MKCSWLFALLLGSLTATALAQDPPSDAARQEAGEHFRQGVELFREGAYRAALVELQRAHELSPDYRVLFNIGQTQLQLGEYVEAIKAFEAYLVQGGAAVDPKRREDTEMDLASLRKRVATLAINVNTEGADVYVDSALVGKSPLGRTVPVSVGRHRVFAQGADGASASLVIDVAGGDLKELSLELVAKVREPAPVVVAASAPPAPPPAMAPRKRWAIGLLTSGVALGAGAGIAGYLAKRSRDAYADDRAALPGQPRELADSRDQLRLRSYVSDGLTVGALALGVSSLVLFVLGDDTETKAGVSKVELAVMPHGLLARGEF